MKQFNSIPIETVGEFMQEVKKVTSTFSEKTQENLFWFRGESDSNFKNPLIPGSYRMLASAAKTVGKGVTHTPEKIRKVEKDIDAEFLRKGHQYLKELDIENSYLNRYFIMQHYGVPTRLLDWSENALVALFFAVNSSVGSSESEVESEVKGGAVYVLEPFELNNFTVQKILETQGEFEKIPTVISEIEKEDLLNEEGELRVDELYRRYLKMDFRENKSYFPLAIMPPPLEKRMLSQAGCFTVFGNEIKGFLDDAKSKFLRKLVIKEDKKDEILKELELLGINEESIFSDLDGLGRYLKRKYRDNYQPDLPYAKSMLESREMK